jgi:branched-chain amino acid transport system substrate-binding protein
MAAVKLAVKEINDAGGVLGKDVTIESRDSGDGSMNIAQGGVDNLLDAHVDAIIGANNSSVTKNVIEKITGAGVLQISPGNTSTELTDFPDKGLYFRTAPSDIYQGRVVGQTALDDGAETLGILGAQDTYGTSLAEQAAKAFTEGGGKLAPDAAIIYDPKASDYSAEIGKIKAADPDAIVQISLGGPDSTKLIEEMVKQGLLPLSKSKKKLYFVDGNLLQSYTLAPGTLEGVKGTTPGAKPSDAFKSKLATINPNLKDFAYAGESYDAVMLVALAAEAAKSDDGKKIAEKMQDVSSGGTKCTTFAECVEMVKDGKDIDYEGLSGPVEFDAKGEPTVAAMGIYQYGADNKFTPLKFVTGPIAGGKSSVTVNATAEPSSSAEPTDEPTDEPSDEPSAEPSASASSSSE